MNLLRLLITLLFLFIIPASLKAQYAYGDVIVLLEDEAIPEGAMKKGNVKKGDGMRLDCGYDKTLEIVKDKARELGANIIKLTQVKRPDMMSTCYRIKAVAYYYENMASFLAEKQLEDKNKMAALIPDTASYALLYMYRHPSGVGPLVSYNLHVGDSVYRMKHNTAYITKLYKKGRQNIWARTEARDQVDIDVEFGKIYFLSCNVRMGVLVGEPDLMITDFSRGYKEFKQTRLIDDGAIPQKELNGDDIYK